MQIATEDYPHLDIGPIQYLLNASYTPRKATGWRCGPNVSVCDPPVYNSMGFVFLGLALLGQANATTWEHCEFTHLLLLIILLLPANPLSPSFLPPIWGPC